MWSRRVFGADAEAPVDAWRRSFAPDAYGNVLDSGHFLMEEKPEEVLLALWSLLS